MSVVSIYTARRKIRVQQNWLLGPLSSFLTLKSRWVCFRFLPYEIAQLWNSDCQVITNNASSLGLPVAPCVLIFTTFRHLLSPTFRQALAWNPFRHAHRGAFAVVVPQKLPESGCHASCTFSFSQTVARMDSADFTTPTVMAPSKTVVDFQHTVITFLRLRISY